VSRPLHRAVRTRCAAAVKALLDSGADARAVNRKGSTPMLLATQSTGRGGTGSVAAKAQQAEILRAWSHMTDVSFGSNSDLGKLVRHVSSTPDNRHHAQVRFVAITGLLRNQGAGAFCLLRRVRAESRLGGWCRLR
jgi:hypothetical protein